mgnify:CR=1 FL=1
MYKYFESKEIIKQLDEQLKENKNLVEKFFIYM